MTSFLLYTARPPRARNAKRTTSLGRAALSLVLLCSVAGCSAPSGVEGDIPDRETFIAIYVDLRLAALVDLAQEIQPAERDSILEAYGVTADDLVAFADLHGRDVPYMSQLWADVEELINKALELSGEDQDSIGGEP